MYTVARSLWSCSLVAHASIALAASGLLSITEFPTGMPPAEVRRLTRVQSLPTYGSLTSVNLYSAYATVKSSANAHMHFELFEADHADAPVVVYLMGGPGVPGFGGWGIMHNAPVRVHDREPRIIDNSGGSWQSLAHVLWLDAPVHVGYSIASPDFYVNCTLCQGSSDDYASQVVNAVKQILVRFGHAGKPLHIAGLSYGGKYVPAVASKILDSEAELAADLASVVLFGSWTDPPAQAAGQVSYYVDGGLIPSSQAAPLRELESETLRLLHDGRFKEANALNANLTETIAMRTALAPVDVTLPLDDLVAIMVRVTTVANMRSFKAAMHVPTTIDWEIHDNDGPVAAAMENEVMASYFELLPQLMKRRNTLQVVFVSGQFDSVVRAAQVEEMIERATATAGVDGWADASRQPWSPNGSLLGSVRGAGNVKFYVLSGEGHIAGLRRPEASFAVMQEILQTQVSSARLKSNRSFLYNILTS